MMGRGRRRDARFSTGSILCTQSLMFAAVAATVMILPGALNRFVFPKLALATAVSALVLWRGRPSGRMPGQVKLLLAAAAAVLVVAALAGESPIAALLGRGPRYEGLVAVGPYVLMWLVGGHLWGPGRSRADSAALVRALAVSALAVGLLAVIEAAGLRPLESSVARTGSLLGNATDQGAWALLAAGPLAAIAVVTLDRWAIVGVLAAAVALATSGSRAALAGGVVLAVALLCTLAGRRRRMSVAAALAGMLLMALAIPATRDRLLGNSQLAGSTVTGRRALWGEAARLVVDHPLLGVGPSGFLDALPAYHRRDWYASYGTGNPPDGPHNLLLQAGSAGGLLLIALMVALLIVVAVLGLRRLVASPTAEGRALQAGLLAGLSAYGLVLLTTPTSTGPMLLASMLAGAAVAAPPSETARPRRSQLSSVACGAAAAVLTVFLLCAAFAEIPLRYALVAASRGQAAQAQINFKHAQVLRPWDIEVSFAAGHAMAAVGDTQHPSILRDAAAWLTQAQRRVPNSWQVLADLAQVRESQGHLPTAERLLTHAHALAPNDPDILLSRGVVRAESAQYAAAEQDFLRVTSIAPKDAAAWQDLAQLYKLQGRDGLAARATAEAHVRNAPQTPDSPN